MLNFLQVLHDGYSRNNTKQKLFIYLFMQIYANVCKFIHLGSTYPWTVERTCVTTRYLHQRSVQKW